MAAPRTQCSGFAGTPALPSATGAVFLGAFALLALTPESLFGDPDTLWHVAVGRDIIRAGSVPWTDTYSYTFAGAPWIAKEWLAQVLLAAAHAVAGWAGVALIAAGAAAGAFALLHGFLARRLSPHLALAVALVAALLCAPHLLARPHVLALPLIVLWARGLVDAAEDGRAPHPRLALVMLAWANLHAGATIGFALAGLVALDAMGRSPAGDRVRLAFRWLGFLGLAIAAACATPYGPRAMLVSFTLFSSGEPLPYITEWQPLDTDVLGLLAVALMILTLGVLVIRPRENLFRIALVGLLAAMTLRHARFLELFALVAPIVAVDPILRVMPPSRPQVDPAGDAPGRVVTLLVALVVVAFGLRQHPVPEPRNTPQAALRAAEAASLTAGRVYNSYDFGGFLIAHGIKTFIDGRSDQIFLGGFTRAAHEAANAAEDRPLLALLDRYDVTWALVQTGSPEAHHLARAPGWRAIHADPVASVFARRTDEPR